MDDNLIMVYDVRSMEFIDEATNTILSAQFIMLSDTATVIETIYEKTGVEVDDFYIEVLRDTIEACTPTLPFGN